MKLCAYVWGVGLFNPLDPWSGDLAFPGGKVENIDTTLHDVAARETMEEVGLLLPPESLIGRMEKMGATGPRRKPTPVWPLIYLLESAPAPFQESEEMTIAHLGAGDSSLGPTALDGIFLSADAAHNATASMLQTIFCGDFLCRF